MGIPSYFTQLIKRNPNIIKDFKKNKYIIHHLLFDANSIIYDVVKKLETPTDNHKTIIFSVIEKIEEYIEIVNPLETVYISFDGIVPLAKMEQQRTRRFRSSYLEELNPRQSNFNTINITCGTSFMNTLNIELYNYYKNREKVIVSGSDEIGEGEHKIYNFVKNNTELFNKKNTYIYGLDSDLIMLSLQNLQHFKSIFLLREVQHFNQVLTQNKTENELYLLDINELSREIYKEIGNNKEDLHEVMNYYVFMCYVFGNDFIPTLNCVNLKTNGLERLMNIIKNKKHEFINKKTNQISWNKMYDIFLELEQNEKKYMIEELRIRKRQEEFTRKKNDEEINKEHLPLLDRRQENYIFENIENNDEWKDRYYEVVFDISPLDKIKQRISINKICRKYCESIEWVYYYYNTGCINWKWNYSFPLYAPLVCDLVYFLKHYSFNNNVNFIIPNKTNYVKNSLSQLVYVLPPQHYGLIENKNIINEIIRKIDVDDVEFVWILKKYTHEIYPKLKPIKIKDIEEIVFKNVSS